MIKVIIDDIKWDLDEEDKGIILPEAITVNLNMTADELEEDYLSDYITDLIGFTHNGFTYDILREWDNNTQQD